MESLSFILSDPAGPVLTIDSAELAIRKTRQHVSLHLATDGKARKIWDDMQKTILAQGMTIWK